jgi:hypothetical protein
MPTGHPASFPPECWHFAVSILQATELPRGSRPFWMRALGSTKTWKCFKKNTSSHWLVAAFNPIQEKQLCQQGVICLFCSDRDRDQGPKNWTKHIPKNANNVAPANCRIPDSGVWTFGVYAKFLRNIFQNIPPKKTKYDEMMKLLKVAICRKVAPCAWCTTFDTMDWTTSQWGSGKFLPFLTQIGKKNTINTISKQIKPSPLYEYLWNVNVNANGNGHVMQCNAM